VNQNPIVIMIYVVMSSIPRRGLPLWPDKTIATMMTDNMKRTTSKGVKLRVISTLMAHP